MERKDVLQARLNYRSGEHESKGLVRVLSPANDFIPPRGRDERTDCRERKGKKDSVEREAKEGATPRK